MEQAYPLLINFNPVDAYRDFNFEGAALRPGYRPEINLNFLKKMGLQEIPVLLYQDDTTMHLIRGEQAIDSFIETQCETGPQLPTLQESVQMSSSLQPLPLPIQVQEEGCSIEEACEDPLEQSSQSLN